MPPQVKSAVPSSDLDTMVDLSCCIWDVINLGMRERLTAVFEEVFQKKRTRAEAAGMIGIERGDIAVCLALPQFSTDVQSLIQERQLPINAIRYLAKKLNRNLKVDWDALEQKLHELLNAGRNMKSNDPHNPLSQSRQIKVQIFKRIVDECTDIDPDDLTTGIDGFRSESQTGNGIAPHSALKERWGDKISQYECAVKIRKMVREQPENKEAGIRITARKLGISTTLIDHYLYALNANPRLVNLFKERRISMNTVTYFSRKLKKLRGSVDEDLILEILEAKRGIISAFDLDQAIAQTNKVESGNWWKQVCDCRIAPAFAGNYGIHSDEHLTLLPLHCLPPDQREELEELNLLPTEKHVILAARRGKRLIILPLHILEPIDTPDLTVSKVCIREILNDMRNMQRDRNPHNKPHIFQDWPSAY